MNIGSMAIFTVISKLLHFGLDGYFQNIYLSSLLSIEILMEQFKRQMVNYKYV